MDEYKDGSVFFGCRNDIDGLQRVTAIKLIEFVRVGFTRFHAQSLITIEVVLKIGMSLSQFEIVVVEIWGI